MSIFGNIWDEDDRAEEDHAEKDIAEDNAKLNLRREELDISKNKVQKGEVELGKEIIEEQKVIDVPVTREEIVIERRALNNEASDSPIQDEETIRIPVNEETVNVNKHTVLTGEVSAHKRAIEDTRHVEETLKREEARVNRIGDPNVIDSDTTD